MSLTPAGATTERQNTGTKYLPAVVKNHAAKGSLPQITRINRDKSRLGMMRQPFLRPQGVILNYILSLEYSDSRHENDNLVMDGR